MKTIIEVNINKKTEFYSLYNDKKLASELSEYLIEECYGESVDNNIVININCNYKLTEKEKETMIDSIRKNYGLRIQDEEFYMNREKGINLILFSGGIVTLFLYYILFKEVIFISEIVLIIGWLAIWESIYRFLFDGLERKSKIRRLQKLTQAKINIKQKNAE